jgi:hypothetical protein
MLDKKHFSAVLIAGILFISVYMSNPDINSAIVHKAHGHSFTPDDHALFIATIDQFREESKLVKASIANNNLTLAKGHADKAANLYFQNLMFEIAEKDQKMAEDLSIVVKSLQNITSSASSSSAASAAFGQQQQANQLVNDIDTKAGEITTTTIRQQQGGLGFLDPVFGAISSIFGEKKEDGNTKLHSLRVAELGDMVLRSYGNAYAVGFDMTNMSNMAMTNGNSTMSRSGSSIIDDNNGDRGMDHMGMGNMPSSGMAKSGINMSKNHSPINVAEYQSAQALSAKALEIFNSELRPMTQDNSSTVSISNLEKGLIQLNRSIGDKASPMDIMMVVHTQIHPNLLEAFNIPLNPGV